MVSTLSRLAAGPADVSAEEGPATGPEDGPDWVRAAKRGLLKGYVAAPSLKL